MTMIKRTPFLLRMIGYPPYRRWVALVHVGGDHSHWEYLWSALTAAKEQQP